VKPTRYVLKPLNSNPLQWLLNSKSIIFPLPVPMAVTSAFGWRMHPIAGNWSMHSGIDIGAPQGTPVLAAYDGQVTFAQEDGGYGLSIVLDHNQGEQQTRYAHLSEILVKPGQWVPQGALIGLVGSTGNSTGPHLHFEALQRTPQGMVVIDPTQSLQQALAQLVAKMPNHDPTKAIATAQSKPLTASSASGLPAAPSSSQLQAQNPGLVSQSAKGQGVNSPANHPQVSLQPPTQTPGLAPTPPQNSVASVAQPQAVLPNSAPVRINPPILNPNPLRSTAQSPAVVPQATPQQQQRLIEVQLLPLTP
jgi:murein DD-endopeptidase MepM/ murein hydrolase activator NlpD